ncbi:hypothetical protein MMC28_011288 [Mycoblastus sanguinarius]|nr:hypothetical protein [Mycoblastus sanguinarius]
MSSDLPWGTPGQSSKTPQYSNPTKKRTRDESSLVETSDCNSEASHDLTPNSPDSVYRKIIPHVDSLPGPATMANTQTETLFEKKLSEGMKKSLEKDASQETDVTGDLPKRKFLRRETSSGTTTAKVTSSAESSKAAPEDPVIDEYSRVLGVGWTKIGEDPDVVASMRGCARYIDRHYPVRGSEIIIKSKSLDAYLVKTDLGYFLFKEDLSRGGLVALGWQDTLARLQNPSFDFEGLDTALAQKTPEGSTLSDPEVGDSDTSMSVGNGGDVGDGEDSGYGEDVEDGGNGGDVEDVEDVEME